VVRKIDQLFKDTQDLENIKKSNQLKANKLSIELNMQKTIEVINEV
jgi:hypothetical protein